jgi:hypothetical protein
MMYYARQYGFYSSSKLTIMKYIWQKTSRTVPTNSVTDGQACPNCWGNQEYACTYLDKGQRGPKAFIGRFVEKYLTGIQPAPAVIRPICVPFTNQRS